MQKADGAGAKTAEVDWDKVKDSLKQATDEMQDAARSLSAARDRVKDAKDRSASELELLKEELDDIRGRFGDLRDSLDSQSGPVIEPEGGEDEEDDAAKDGDG